MGEEPRYTTIYNILRRRDVSSSLRVNLYFLVSFAPLLTNTDKHQQLIEIGAVFDKRLLVGGAIYKCM